MKQIGIWLDKEKAILISLLEGKHKIKNIESDIIIKERIPGESKSFGRFGSQFFSKENKKKNRIKKQTTAYLKKIVLEIVNYDEIAVFGPAEMKIYLEKAILKNNKTKRKLLAVESADSMTENQLVALVKKFYNK